jgi:hypothetical protein
VCVSRVRRGNGHPFRRARVQRPPSLPGLGVTLRAGPGSIDEADTPATCWPSPTPACTRPNPPAATVSAADRLPAIDPGRSSASVSTPPGDCLVILHVSLDSEYPAERRDEIRCLNAASKMSTDRTRTPHMRNLLSRLGILAGVVLTLGACIDNPTQSDPRRAPDLATSGPVMDTQLQGCIADGLCPLPRSAGDGASPGWNWTGTGTGTATKAAANA